MNIGPFEVLGIIGEGASGIVYRARDQSLGRTVALKKLHRELKEDDPAAERFHREAEAMVSLRADHVVSVYSHQIVDGSPLLEMEYVAGGNLAGVTAAGPIALHVGLQLVEHLLLALKAFHDAGILHRAVRPSNVLLDEREDFKLADARLSIMGSEETSTLGAGSIVYIAPECVFGRPFDASSDLYSAGMVAYEALLGRSAFQEAFPGLMPVAAFATKWLEWLNDNAKTVPPLHEVRPDVSVTVSQFVARLVAKDPELRFATADAALLAMRSLRTLPVVPKEEEERTPPSPPVLRERQLLRRDAAPAVKVQRQRAAAVSHTVYFMSLVGGLAGLLCWAITTWVADYLTVRQEATPVLLTLWTTIMGALMGGMTVGFADRWSGDRLLGRWVATGTLLGTAAGFVSGLVYIPIQLTVVAVGGFGARDVFARVSLWMIAGCFIGLVTGLRWYSVNPYRAVHAMAGGIVGGMLGGLAFQYTSHMHEFFAALAFVLTGMGISLGVTLAPVLLRNGVLQFVRSDDERARSKYGPQRQEWPIQAGDRLLIGSERAGEAMTMYARNIQVYIPDTMVAPRHAILFEREKHFYLQPHGGIVAANGRLEAPLQVGGIDVVDKVDLHHGDEILIGQTVLRFCLTKKSTAVEPALLAAGSSR